MAWDGNGNVIRTNGTNTGGTVWQDDADADVKIRADRHDTHDQDLADAIEQALNRNGENAPSTNIGWGNHRITNLQDGNSAKDAATVGQVQSQIAGVAQASGTDALTATFSPALTALTDKTTVYARAAAANTSTTPTFKPNALTAKTITKEGNKALVAGDIAGAAHVIILQYNASNDVWELLNPSTSSTSGGGNFPNVDSDVTATDEDMNSVLTPYAAARVVLGGDFDADQEVVCERIGNTVTISSFGTLSHSINNFVDSSSGAIPSSYRPTNNVANCYSGAGSANDGLCDVEIMSTGTLRVTYRDYSGGVQNNDDTGLHTSFTISYVIVGNVT